MLFRQFDFLLARLWRRNVYGVRCLERTLIPALDMAIKKIRLGLQQFERYQDDMDARRLALKAGPIHWPVAFSKDELKALVNFLDHKGGNGNAKTEKTD